MLMALAVARARGLSGRCASSELQDVERAVTATVHPSADSNTWTWPRRAGVDHKRSLPAVYHPGALARRSSDETRENRVREELAALLRRARTRVGWSQTELQVRLAESLGVEAVAPNTISRYERGVLAPTLGTLDALCSLLGGEGDALVRALAQALGEAEAGDGAAKIRVRKRGR